MTSTPTSLVVSLKKQLSTAVTKDQPQEIASILQQLKKQVIATEDLIRETKIGVTVNKLKSNPNKAVADLAREIVKKWKNDVGVAASSSSTGGAAKSKPPVSGAGERTASATGSGAELTCVAGLRSASNAPSPSPAPASPVGPIHKTSTSTTKRPPPTSTTAPKEEPTAAPTTTTTTTTASPSKTSSTPVPKRRQSLNGAPRTHTTDGLDFFSDEYSLHDKTRDKCVEMIYDAMSFDSDAPTDLICKRAQALEQHVHINEPSAGYRAKIRSLYLNLKAANNPSLREDVVSGEISVTRLYGMSPAVSIEVGAQSTLLSGCSCEFRLRFQEMASEEQQALNRKLAEENLFKAQGAAPQQAETDAFQCGKCKQRRTMYYQMQTRSADEPMTTFVTCLNCNNRWKFS
ncbi:BZ3500_MvSof-1268-A1-R1_Chr1-2g01419 [Microbotryum saponariae]|uniref:BZ3500_MvSof-1268-A1-R1_Chr1-2g01419 protein n=1 Tax=Microbotryum saponariae TaxID=289078 RepID=A0A2X0MSX8_9BASI|nr:BZ3500_MvSof-1268-A1-R1_Chr1-2g01419 [Microbotryum saponariae]SCZ97380.1 BZ3501_MvSof-1269-A2-R1_Chr1-2g01018 [Microbotryum saponariae]